MTAPFVTGTTPELPLAVQTAGSVTLVVTFEGGRNFVVSSEVFEPEYCLGWADAIQTLRTQREALLPHGLPVTAVYYPNPSLYSERDVTF